MGGLTRRDPAARTEVVKNNLNPKFMKTIEMDYFFEQHQVQTYLTQSVFNVVLQKSTPPQIRQLILYVSNSK